MREKVLAAAALLALTGPTCAAGLEEPVYSAQQGVSWTGCYAGGQAGYGAQAINGSCARRAAPSKASRSAGTT
jgi:opacity protein-like surface antigen